METLFCRTSFPLKLCVALIWFFCLKGTSQIVNMGEVTVLHGTTVSMVSDFDNTETGQFYNDGDAFIYANFDNDGIWDYYEQGLVRFVGRATQRITGTQPSYMHDILFENTSGSIPFHLYGDISIANQCHFNQGIINNKNYQGDFTFLENGSPVNTSDIGHVNGSVMKYGTSGFTYPVGDEGHFRFAGMSAPDNMTNFSAEYYLESPDELYSIESKDEHIVLIDDQEYWQVQKLDGNSDILLTLSWDEETTPSEIWSAPLHNLVIVRWDENQHKWMDQGGAVDVANKTVTTAIKGYGAFTLAKVKDIGAIPCDLEVYNAISPDGNGQNDFFRIDHANDGCVKTIRVKVFNRWGVKVYESDDYGKPNEVFRGYSEARLTVNSNTTLPTGTYYYTLEVDYISDEQMNTYVKVDYLFLTKD